MNQNSPNLSEWEICPPGLLHEAATVREPSWWPSVLLAVASVVAIIAILFQIQPAAEPAPAITSQACVMTRQVMVDFVRGEIKDCGVRKRIGCHIYHCTDCRKVFCQTKREHCDGPDTLVNPRLPCECP